MKKAMIAAMNYARFSIDRLVYQQTHENKVNDVYIVIVL